MIDRHDGTLRRLKRARKRGSLAAIERLTAEMTALDPDAVKTIERQARECIKRRRFDARRRA
jgi:hypothetical protein